MIKSFERSRLKLIDPSTEIDIDKAIEILQLAKKEGATHVSGWYDTYIDEPFISFTTVREETEQEIQDRLKHEEYLRLNPPKRTVTVNYKQREQLG